MADPLLPDNLSRLFQEVQEELSRRIFASLSIPDWAVRGEQKPLTVSETFLADIIEHPTDDTPRLIYADWLDDHGQSERAEFIRVQCQLAKREQDCKHCRVWTNISQMADPGVVRTWCLGCDAFRRREQELFAWIDAHEQRTPANYGPGWWETILPDLDWQWTWRRGFITKIRCKLADWCGKECNWCRSSGTEQLDDTTYWSEAPKTTCRKCRGTGRVGGHGRALVKACPLEQVRLTDREPRRVPGGSDDYDEVWYWDEEGHELDVRSSLPSCIFRLFPSIKLPRVVSCNLGWVSREEGALFNASEALLAWAKGMPPKQVLDTVVHGDPSAPRPQGIIDARRGR